MSKLSSVFSASFFRGSYEDKRSSCPFELIGTKAEKKRLAALVDRICRNSVFGCDLMEKSAEQGYSLSFEYWKDVRGCADSDEKRIILNPAFSDKVLVATLAHEARHAGQFANGAAEEGGLSAACRLKEGRLMEADAVAASVVVCCDLKNLGDKTPLKALKENYPRIVAAYERNVSKDADMAQTAAALAWYNDEETKFSYEFHDFIEPLSGGAGLKHAHEQCRDMSSEELLNVVCGCDGRNYFSEPPSVLDTPERAGISEISAAWLDWHLKTCKECGVAENEIDPSLKRMAVYSSTEFMKMTAHGCYRFPEPLDERGRMCALRIETKRRPSAAMLLSRKSPRSL